MEITKNQELINRYFDGELNKEEEIFLFSQLSTDEENRKYFKSLNLIREAVEQTIKNVPFEIDSKIMNALPLPEEKLKSYKNFFQLPAMISYAVSIILLIVTFFIYSENFLSRATEKELGIYWQKKLKPKNSHFQLLPNFPNEQVK